MTRLSARLSRIILPALLILPMAGCVTEAPPPPPRPVPARPAPPPRPVPPPPVAAGGIVLYAQARYAGPATRLSRDVPNLRGSGFDDHVRSVQVTGRPWQLCSLPFYRGQCVTVRHAAPNLARLGLGNEISSVRRLP